MASMPRYLGRMVIPRLIKKGYSVPAVVRYLRRTTGGWRYQTMLSDVRESRGIIQFGKAVKSLRPDVIPLKRFLVETELKGARKYRVFGTAKYVNKETGRTTYEDISFYDNQVRTKDDWKSEYIRMKQEAEYREEVTCEEVDIFSIEHNKGWTY